MKRNFFYKMWRNYLPYPLVFMGKMTLRLILLTCKIEIDGIKNLVAASSDKGCILTLWHNRLMILPEIVHRFASQFTYCAFISNSRDGDLLNILTNSYKIGKTLRVSHNARHHALNQMINQLRSTAEVVVITPDGPRGPRYEIKPGLILAAKETGSAIVPFTWSANRFWQLNSWDKMILPKPFSRICINFGDPIYKEKEASQDIKEEVVELQNQLIVFDQKAHERVTLKQELWPK